MFTQTEGCSHGQRKESEGQETNIDNTSGCSHRQREESEGQETNLDNTMFTQTEGRK